MRHQAHAALTALTSLLETHRDLYAAARRTYVLARAQLDDLEQLGFTMDQITD